MVKIWIFACWLALLLKGGMSVPRIEPRLAKIFQREGTADIVVTMRNCTSFVLKGFDGKAFATRGQRITSMVTGLEEHASTSQSSVIKLLEEKATRAGGDFSYRSFWISNQIFIRGASHDLVERLSAFNEIEAIGENFEVQLSAGWTSEASAAHERDKDEEMWNIARIKAPEVWDQEKNNGSGIVVATIDTGVRGTHEALRNNYRKNYGWYDHLEQTKEPSDDSGRGTHVMGTLVGAGIGVAPGSQWISCKACSHYFCKLEALLACATFIVCPHDYKGDNKNCSMAPQVVSNSWGISDGDRSFHRRITSAWYTAGIIPIFSAGWNEQQRCDSIGSPAGSDEVIAVGAIDYSGHRTSWSSIGPSRIGSEFKPDVLAPGVNICSASLVSDTDIWCSDSDSWTAPHVAGTVALMLASRPRFEPPCYEDVRIAFKISSEQVDSAGLSCLGVGDHQRPNYHHGYGLVNALEAVRFYKKYDLSCR